MGNPVSYQIIPYAGGTHPVAKGAQFAPDEWIYHRLSFMDKQLWVTRYHPGERFPEGKYPNRACRLYTSGPVIANYGLENLRFIEPVKPGDTIQVRLTCKRKTLKKQRSAEEKPPGVVEWAVEVFNQHQTPVALYSILTLVARPVSYTHLDVYKRQVPGG